MKLMMTERMKHRLTGLIVMLSIAVIMIPAMVKQSNQHFAEAVNVSVRLPPKPKMPVVVIPKAKQMFAHMKITKIDLPAIPEAPPKSQIARLDVPSKPVVDVVNVAPSIVAKAERVPTKSPKPITKPTAQLLPQQYAVQLASFSKSANASHLVERLKLQGYDARFIKLSTAQGLVYKVMVGPLKQRTAALEVQKKLANNLKLNGFIVKSALG